MEGFLASALSSAFLLALLLLALGFVSLVAVPPLFLHRRTLSILFAACGAPFWVSAVYGSTVSSISLTAFFVVAAAQILLVSLSFMMTPGVHVFGVKETSLREAVSRAGAKLNISTESFESPFDDVLVRVQFSSWCSVGYLELIPRSESHMLAGFAYEVRQALRDRASLSTRAGVLQMGTGGLLMAVATVSGILALAVPYAKRHPQLFDISSAGGAETSSAAGVNDSSTAESAWLGKVAPGFELETLSGETIRLSDVVGERVVVLNFFATWCGPCKKEMPELVRFHEAHRSAPLLFLGVDAEESRKKVEKFRDKYEVRYPIGIDQGEIMQSYGVRAYPTTVVIGLDGTIKDYRVGMVSDAEKAFASFLGEAQILALSRTSSNPPIDAGVDSNAVLFGLSFADLEAPLSEDTFNVARAKYGAPGIRLQNEVRVSGYSAIQIDDVAGNGGIPDLQGRFPLATEGKTYVHFSFLSRRPEGTMHMALAGPQWFSPVKDGIGFWLTGQNGVMTLTTTIGPKRVMDIQPFTWYSFDVTYDVSGGTYDLSVREEGRRVPIVEFTDVQNVSGEAGSRIDKISFIGDRSDQTHSTFLVDDVVVSNDPSVFDLPFGRWERRTPFCEEVRHLQAIADASKCPAVTSLLDLGGFGAFSRSGAVDLFQQGCDLLDSDGPPLSSVTLFDKTARLAGASSIGNLAAALALAEHGDLGAAESRLEQWRSMNPGDRRYLGARVRLAEIASQRDGSSEQTPLASSADARYFSTFWVSDFVGAGRIAKKEIETSASNSTEQALWHERFADAAFCGGWLSEAEASYKRALSLSDDGPQVYPKLLDLHVQQKDFVSARLIRRRIFDEWSKTWEAR